MDELLNQIRVALDKSPCVPIVTPDLCPRCIADHALMVIRERLAEIECTLRERDKMRALVKVRSVDGKRSLVITLPKPIRDNLAIHQGDYVMITVKGMFKFEVEKDPVRKENMK